GDRRWELFQSKQANIQAEKTRLAKERVKEHDNIGQRIAADTGQRIKGSITLADLLRRPGFHYLHLDSYGLGQVNLAREEKEGAEIDIKYSGYIQRQQAQIEQVSKNANRKLPDELDYNTIDTLSKEARERLSKVRPLTVGQASRIGGVNPADINALLVYLEIQARRQGMTADKVAIAQ
ncbi:MAG: tRNA uridine-5-carboxymethylaminomethyl(34) synthesis enzyme MnmG, partial [Cyanobacteria bacterium P01_H01_bin.152]